METFEEFVHLQKGIQIFFIIDYRFFFSPVCQLISAQQSVLLRRLRQEDYKFKASMGYTVRQLFQKQNNTHSHTLKDDSRARIFLSILQENKINVTNQNRTKQVKRRKKSSREVTKKQKQKQNKSRDQIGRAHV